MVRLRDYYRRWLSVAVRHSWGVTDTVSTALSLVVPAVAKLISDGGAMADLVWQIPLTLFGTLFIVRVVLAPWWIHKEQEQSFEASLEAQADDAEKRHLELMGKLDSMAAERDASAKTLTEMHAKAEAKLATVADIAEAFRGASKAGKKLLESRTGTSIPNWEGWVDYARRLAALALRPSSAEELESSIRGARAPDPRSQPRFTVDACIKFFNGWQRSNLLEGRTNPGCTLEELNSMTATQP